MKIASDTALDFAVDDSSGAAKSSSVERGRVRFLFLDGLRGISAVYILLFHAHSQVDWYFQPPPFTGMAAWIRRFLGYGHGAVAVFIVLSGYCLMLPVARPGSFAIPGGIRRYLLRRGRRILPPYYAALALSLLLIVCAPLLRHPGGETWAAALPALDSKVIISHLLLLHSFSPQWCCKINPPMWSVGVEWWIYFLFPMVLLPLWRRAGMYATLSIITVATVGTHWLPGRAADYMCPWYFALFTFGAAGAFINSSPRADFERSWNWAWLGTTGLVVSLLLLTLAPGLMLARPLFMDLVIGASVTAVMVWCGKRAQETDPSFVILRILESRIALWLGSISYSLYLVHDPVIALISPAIRATGWSAEMRFYAHILTGLAASLPIAYIFHRIFERPFAKGHSGSAVKVALSGAIEPAPLNDCFPRTADPEAT
jgi:peptidoglycan/LPS O-acetylase OafA/YrhL